MDAHRGKLEADLHRARLANLRDDPPELAEPLDAYVARTVHKYGLTYFDAAVEIATERHRSAAKREARAEAAARTAITRAMRKAR